MNMVTPQRQIEGQTGFTPKKPKVKKADLAGIILVNSFSPRIIKRLFLGFLLLIFFIAKQEILYCSNTKFQFFFLYNPLPPLNCLTILSVGVLIVVIEGIHV